MIFENQILKMYRSMAFTRCDDTGNVFYFSADDFDGLNREPYDFVSSLGHKLSGNIYYYGNCSNKRIIVFDHGFGGGHRSYMKEIEMLCRHGYTVFAYDHTGCMESGGESTNGMGQSLCDLNDCISTLKADSRFSGTDFSVMGHSWGGFSTLNISSFHPDVSHIVVISGFVSVEKLVDTYFKGPLKIYRKAVMALEKQSNPKTVGCNAVDSLSKTDAKVLLIYSADDKLCSREHFDILKANLADKKNIRFILTEKKGHNPNFTEDAVKYKDAFFASLTKKNKKKQLETAEAKREFINSYDWNRMTAQDDAVWTEIFNTLDN